MQFNNSFMYGGFLWAIIDSKLVVAPLYLFIIFLFVSSFHQTIIKLPYIIIIIIIWQRF